MSGPTLRERLRMVAEAWAYDLNPRLAMDAAIAAADRLEAENADLRARLAAAQEIIADLNRGRGTMSTPTLRFTVDDVRVLDRVIRDYEVFIDASKVDREARLLFRERHFHLQHLRERVATAVADQRMPA